MGFKRTFDAEDAQDFNVKHARQISYCNKLAKLDEGVPYRGSLEKSGVIGEDLSGLYEFKCEGNLEKKGFEINDAPFSWITTGVEEDAESGATTQSTLSEESPESDFVWKPSPADDVYPVKPVPIGSNHQADIPECVKEQVRDQDEEQVMMGKCVVPMPDCETEVGKGRKECVCMDKGSIRCVQQHIMESREGLFESIGYETCLKLGLGEMGEEVAGKLSEEEEDRFHEIVYSNPVSLDLDFWQHLKYAFPSRTMKEIVSYYFNVFVLRRRAVQNRSKTLDVDSDDDEWHVDYDDNNNSYGAETPDEKTGKSLSRDDEEEEEEEEEEVMNVDENSCMSYDREESNVGNYWRHCSDDDLVEDHSYRFDPCDSMLPDHCWSKNIDLLPTSNIIDEIFGEDTSSWNDFSRGK
ncbi:unnamed protein product [Microthlaspi erraticum]|uniref:ELM2 domain-containing protein n=1 Tax=Microthlaspi erraticum TaxID=1685480 RepID=A0A6D2JHA9_9BRAS|nr:unnamed protein product [Microthlaspi erraticum]